MLTKSDEEYIAKFTKGMDAYSILPANDGGWICIGIGPAQPQKTTSKTFGGSLAWVGEARVPAGNGDDSGEWTDDPSGSVVDVADKPPYDYCANTDAVRFVKQHEQEAAAIAAEYKIPTYYILGLSARECKYGKSHLMHENTNAFFSLEKLYSNSEINKPGFKPSYSQIPYATGAKQSGGNKNTFVYTYKNFTDSAKSFLDLFGDDVYGASSPDDFLQALQDGGFNSNSSFLDTTVLNDVDERMKCPTPP